MLRRAFLRVSTGALAATLGPLSGCARVPEPRPTLEDPAALGSIADDATIREIGRDYLAGTPREMRTARLVRALLEDERGDLMDQGDPEALRQFLVEKVQADFESDRTVVADGWVLSRTEARQAALLFLTP